MGPPVGAFIAQLLYLLLSVVIPSIHSQQGWYQNQNGWSLYLKFGLGA